MTIRRLNQVGLADVTYIRIRMGFVYLAVLDAYSRKVIGYAVSTSLDTTLTLRALKMVIARRKPDAGVIHHSDQGYSMPQKNMWRSLEAAASRSAWRGWATLTKTP
jgi:putative transposase